MKKTYKIAYVLSDLKRVGPSNQTLNIINNSKYKNDSVVITLFEEPSDSMINEYYEKKINVITLKLDRMRFIINGKKKLTKLLKDYQIKIIHSYGIKADTISQKASKLLRIKHIITLRNYPKEDIITRMNKIKGIIALKTHLKTLRNCEYVVCCSKSIYKKMSNDFPDKTFAYIQNGVDLDKYNLVDLKEKKKFRSDKNLDRYNNIFISTGSLIKRKRIDELIDIFIGLESKNDCLLILGTGDLEKKLKNEYKYNNIIFLGKCNNVIEYLHCSDFFISSSESEGLPNSVIEAVACGIPVILSDIDQHIEIFDELGNIGIKYTLGNPDECVNKIKNINKTDYEKFKDNCKKINNSVFTMKEMSSRYVKYYEKIGDLND